MSEIVTDDQIRANTPGHSLQITFHVYQKKKIPHNMAAKIVQQEGGQTFLNL